MRNLFITLLLIISCQNVQNTETDSELEIYHAFIDYLNDLHDGSKIVISPISSKSDDVSDSFIVYDTLGNKLDYHWITWVYKGGQNSRTL